MVNFKTLIKDRILNANITSKSFQRDVVLSTFSKNKQNYVGQ